MKCEETQIECLCGENKMHSDDCNSKQWGHLHAKSIKLIGPHNRFMFHAPVVPGEVMFGVPVMGINSKIESALKKQVANHVDVLLVHQPSFAEFERKTNKHNSDA